MILLAFASSFLSCDFQKRVEDNVDNGHENARKELGLELKRIKSDFEKIYKYSRINATDSVNSSKIKNLYLSLNKTTSYIDSLTKEISKLDNQDPKNIELVENIFLNQGIADSIFNKLKRTYSFAIEVAQADTTKLRMKKVQNDISNFNKEHLFKMSEPGWCIITLLSFENELIKDGTKSLYGY